MKASCPSPERLETVYNHSKRAGGITHVLLKALWAESTEMQGDGCHRGFSFPVDISAGNGAITHHQNK